MALSHELAHIERRDCWINLLQRIIEAIFFFHPFVWYACSQLTQQGEQICDNYVIEKGAPVLDYTKLLSRIAEKGLERTRFQTVALFEGRLVQRVRSLLDPGHRSQTKASCWVTMAGVAVLIVCLIFGAIRLEAEPNAYDPEAHARYNKMIVAMSEAESLCYTSDYRFEAGGKPLANCTYTVWMEKPYYVRIETAHTTGSIAGTLIGDSDDLWIYWSRERPAFSLEDRLGKRNEKTRFNVYMKEAAPIGSDSIRYKTSRLGAGMGVPIIDPSTFHGHGHTISKNSQIDGIKRIGAKKVGDIECDLIEVFFNKSYETWQLWLSKEDHLPRKLKRVLMTENKDIIIIDEQWSDVTVNAEIPMEKFVWIPPEGWSQYPLPDTAEGLLKPDQEMPDFEFLSTDGTKIRRSDYRGKIVWFYSWRSGLACQREMRDLQKYYQEYKGKNLVVLGFNSSDNKKTALDVMQENSITFPNVIDSSEAAQNYPMSRAMLSYIIDKGGKVVDCWHGYDKDHQRAIVALEESGLRL